MSSVLIRGIEIPTTCRECIIGNPKAKTCIIGKPKMNTKRRDDCPLVEIPTPHGRLIDATFEENHYASMLLNPTPDVTEQDKHKARIVIDALRMAKTVIEAEGSEE